MNAIAGDLARGIQAPQIGSSIEIRADAAHRVVGRRLDGDGTGRYVDPMLPGGLVHAGEPRTNEFRPEMRERGNYDHRLMAEAARSGDVEAATRCAASHMNITMSAAKGLFGDSAAPKRPLLSPLTEDIIEVSEDWSG